MKEQSLDEKPNKLRGILSRLVITYGSRRDVTNPISKPLILDKALELIEKEITARVVSAVELAEQYMTPTQRQLYRNRKLTNKTLKGDV